MKDWGFIVCLVVFVLGRSVHAVCGGGQTAGEPARYAEMKRN